MNTNKMMSEHALRLSEVYRHADGGPQPPVALVQIELVESALPLIRKRATISKQNSLWLRELIATLCSGDVGTVAARFNRDVVVAYCNRRK